MRRFALLFLLHIAFSTAEAQLFINGKLIETESGATLSGRPTTRFVWYSPGYGVTYVAWPVLMSRLPPPQNVCDAVN
jgi:hypothetical protein